MVNKEVPITLVNYLRNDETLIVKDYGSSMKYFILLFQSTCIQSSCEEKFSEILIELMAKLPEVAPVHHNFFIHEFFFPLINAFKGIPVKFVWKNSNNKYLYQATHSLKTRPIKCTDDILVIGDFYLEKAPVNDWSSITDKSGYVVLNKDNEIVPQNQTIELSDKPECEFKLYKNVTQQTSELLTNQTLIKLKNLGIFGPSYMNKVPVQDSTSENIYYLPCEMSLNDILRQVNLCGLRLNEDAVKSTVFSEPKA